MRQRAVNANMLHAGVQNLTTEVCSQWALPSCAHGASNNVETMSRQDRACQGMVFCYHMTPPIQMFTPAHRRPPLNAV